MNLVIYWDGLRLVVGALILLFLIIGIMYIYITDWFNERRRNREKKTKQEKPTPDHKRYNMTTNQPAQIDCRIETCKYYKTGGVCSNVSPAITLDQTGKFACWSRDVR